KKKSEVLVNLADGKLTGVASAEIVTGKDPKAANSYAKPDVITARKFNSIDLKNGQAIVTLPPLSFAAVSFDLR
ncbi:MAG TPA: alpha-L-arabinofuranosidase C-terminal domain-containing protein, partial [Planctomycetota bacterium]|nr:alpha-L-arabinofuranosidase C-terminal domain-containing protein [Planctomycetota bacterium]